MKYKQGSIVEVLVNDNFSNHSWRCAQIVSNNNNHNYTVRLVGCSQQFQVTKFELRVRQTFQNGKWIVVNKVQRDYKDAVDNNVTSSSDSCSINMHKAYEIYNGIEFEGCDSDAESVCQMGYEYDEEESDDDDECDLMADEIHRLELQAYRCTMEALHASGPLTWEKESMGHSSGFASASVS